MFHKLPKFIKYKILTSLSVHTILQFSQTNKKSYADVKDDLFWQLYFQDLPLIEKTKPDDHALLEWYKILDYIGILRNPIDEEAYYLDVAAENGYIKLLKHLLENEYKDEDLKEALDTAVSFDEFEIVKYLVGFAVPDDENFLEAVNVNNIEMVDYFLDLGADIHASDDRAIYYPGSKSLAMFDHLLEKGIVFDEHKNLLLINAGFYKDYDMIKILVNRGATEGLDQILKDAVIYAPVDVVKLLVEKGNVAVDASMLECAKMFNPENYQYLLSLGV